MGSLVRIQYGPPPFALFISEKRLRVAQPQLKRMHYSNKKGVVRSRVARRRAFFDTISICIASIYYHSRTISKVLNNNDGLKKFANARIFLELFADKKNRIKGTIRFR